MAYEIMIELSEKTYGQLKQVARVSQQPIDVIIEHSLSQSIPPLLEKIPPAYQADVYPLLQMSQAELQTEAKRRFPAQLWTQYESLLEHKRQRKLTEEEEAQLDKLRREADVLMFRKGYAAVLLKRRGWSVPSLNGGDYEYTSSLASRYCPSSTSPLWLLPTSGSGEWNTAHFRTYSTQDTRRNR